MNKRKSILILSLASIFIAPSTWAATKTLVFACAGAHFTRLGGTEMVSSSYGFRNGDAVNSMTVERLTIRNVSGAVIHDSGPAAGVPHPLNTDFVVPIDITVVPPGASYYLRTGHIWGNFPLPASAGGGEAGQNFLTTVQVSKAGKKDLMLIGGTLRTRERLALPTGAANEGVERSRAGVDCQLVDKNPAD